MCAVVLIPQAEAPFFYFAQSTAVPSPSRPSRSFWIYQIYQQPSLPPSPLLVSRPHLATDEANGLRSIMADGYSCSGRKIEPLRPKYTSFRGRALDEDLDSLCGVLANDQTRHWTRLS